jgi:hypothetical protein
MGKFKISFWNYEKMGVIEAKKAVADWKDAGFNLAMTFEYRAERDNPADMVELLDECQKKGIMAIVCDRRTRYQQYMEVGEETFREGVKKVVAEFGAHPAVYGFHVGDEPNGEAWESAISAFKIVREEANGKKGFINMFSSWITPECPSVIGTPLEEYEDKVVDFVKRSGADIVSFDCYSQCMYTDTDFEQDEFLRNLHMFANAAKRTGAELFVSLLSVGHWNYRVPNEDDIRWQISMSVAHGVTGMFWFYFYQRLIEENYRGGPINLFGERTPMFNMISYENRLFLEFYAKRLEGYEVDDVSYFRKTYGGYPRFTGAHELKVIETRVNNESVCVTRWVNNEGKVKFTVVNVGREKPTRIRVEFEGELACRNDSYWLAPGQMLIFDEEGVL